MHDFLITIDASLEGSPPARVLARATCHTVTVRSFAVKSVLVAADHVASRCAVAVFISKSGKRGALATRRPAAAGSKSESVSSQTSIRRLVVHAIATLSSGSITNEMMKPLSPTVSA